MRIFKVCDKCRSRYLLYHLKSDCKFAIENFQAIRDLLVKAALDGHLGKSNKGMFDLRLSKIAFPSVDLDRNTTLFEGSRFSSAPFISIFLMVAIGTALGQDKGGLMQGIGVLFIFIWFVFLGRGGFNVIFKQIILYDLMKRYKFKAKEENLNYERRF